MTATFQSRVRVPVGVDALYAAFTDPAFLEARARAMGSLRAKASRADEPGAVVLTLETEDPPNPGQDENVGTMIWRLDPQGRRGTWQRIQRGFEKRARAEGTVALVAAGPDAAEILTSGEIEIKVPILGKMIERKITEAIAKGAAREEQVTADLLRQRA